MTKRQNVAAIVVTYNPGEDVIQNMQTFCRKVNKCYVIDNSERPTITKNLENIKNCEYISLGKNEGIAKALNIGMERAIAENYEWVLTMDQDSRFENDMIGIFLKYINANDCKKVCLLAPQYDYDRHPASEREKESGKEKDLFWVMQSGNLVNAALYQKLGKFKEEYFIDCVDYEYCLRARTYGGYRIVQCSSAVLRHQPAVTCEKKFLMFSLKYGVADPVRIYYQVRNALYMASEYGSLRAFSIVVVKILKIMLLFEKKKEYADYVLKAWRDYRAKITGKFIYQEKEN